ncbi:uncharacterized protein B0H18DRAFT_889183 [Fomitopsis serialis]|uniref:uncharacterized protein n=1 Tax=Fomitopsis serialis TaxID=139415 RepID=UPI002007F342|nr:uncharacterized protein B0H18DRAFT_889183 [Neoantrodia serialis]KAH9912823.1 hypothetical protein B0H18DRAFT_889183 [Neoantrodia serialis]
MDLARKLYPDEDHLFVLDNASTHLKRADDAISARRMPKGPSPARAGNERFGVDVKVNDQNGNLVYGPNGKPLKQCMKMSDVMFQDGTSQSLYYPDVYPQHPDLAGKFKGMAQILIERYPGKEASIRKLKAQCEGFKCTKGHSDCCCRRMLFSEKDFVLSRLGHT